MTAPELTAARAEIDRLRAELALRERQMGEYAERAERDRQAAYVAGAEAMRRGAVAALDMAPEKTWWTASVVSIKAAQTAGAVLRGIRLDIINLPAQPQENPRMPHHLGRAVLALLTGAR